MNDRRDCNIDIRGTDRHPCADDFDLKVMHPFVVRSFEPLPVKGSLLELGSYRGDLTQNGF